MLHRDTVKKATHGLEGKEGQETAADRRDFMKGVKYSQQEINQMKGEYTTHTAHRVTHTHTPAQKQRVAA